MKFKLTEHAKRLKVSEFALNFGINYRDAEQALKDGFVETDSDDVINSLKQGHTFYKKEGDEEIEEHVNMIVTPKVENVTKKENE